jgi:hypothetical protein
MDLGLMKENEVKVDFKEQQIMIYAEKEDGSISPVQTGSYISKTFLDDFHKMTERLYTDLTGKLKKGEISPVYFFMTIEELTISELASRAGISKSSVKRHLDPKGFKKASVSELSGYADAFNIPVANFFQIIKTREDKKWNPGYRDDLEKTELVMISQVKSNNSLIVETKIVHDTK